VQNKLRKLKGRKRHEYAGVDHMELEIGYALIPLVDAGQRNLLDRILLIRRQIPAS
jgi:flagellar biosynthesis component FlhA